MTLRVAIDATPLLVAPTGIGAVTRALVTGLPNEDVDLVAYALSLRAGHRVRDVVPEAVEAARSPMPANMLLRAWSHGNRPKLERWTGPIDVVHGTNFVAPPTRDAAAVISVQDLTPMRYPELCDAASRRYPELVHRALDRGAFVHTSSQYVADEVGTWADIPAERVRVIRYGIPPTDPGNAASGVALAGGPLYILAIGTVEPRKDFPLLVRAFERLSENDDEVRLVIAGKDGVGAQALDSAIVNSKVRSRIVRLGYVSVQERADLLAGATAFAYPSRYEGFGFPPLEAMTAGIPVVASNAGAIPEVVNEAARLFPVGDLEALVDALDDVVHSTTTADALRKRGAERVTQFSWDDCTGAMAVLYRDAAAAR